MTKLPYKHRHKFKVGDVVHLTDEYCFEFTVEMKRLYEQYGISTNIDITQHPCVNFVITHISDTGTMTLERKLPNGNIGVMFARCLEIGYA